MRTSAGILARLREREGLTESEMDLALILARAFHEAMAGQRIPPPVGRECAAAIKKLAAIGYVIVPSKPTEAMVEALVSGLARGTISEAAAAMLAAGLNPNGAIPASGPQTARLCAKSDFGRKIRPKRKPRA